MKALLVDDSSTMRSILRMTLRQAGFETVEADNGATALTKLGQEGAADVALVDWNMPVMNGFEFLCALRQDHKYDKMLVVMVTTETEMSNIQSAVERGANEYIMKPFTKEAVIEKLQLLGLVAQTV
ncbi:MAG TPA: response regulator [Terriglobales bacterium]|nr:response regulator [Terriglobales bacterium]